MVNEAIVRLENQVADLEVDLDDAERRVRRLETERDDIAARMDEVEGEADELADVISHAEYILSDSRHINEGDYDALLSTLRKYV